MHCAKACFAAFLLMINLPARAAADTALIIGVLEERPSGDWDSSLQHGIRVGFVQEGPDWVPLHCQNSKGKPSPSCRTVGNPETKVAWTVYHFGKAVGTAQSGSWIISDLAHEGTLSIMPGPIPAVGLPSSDFGGWANNRAHRPLIALNSARPSFASRWTQDSPHPELLASAWPAFRSVIPAVEVCAKGSDPASQHTLHPSDLKSLPGWRSQSGELLLRFGVDPRLQADCEIRDNPNVWLYRSPGGDVRAIPGQKWNQNEAINFTPSLELVDIGDFAGDGREEALFFFSGYNLDGYVLIYDGFRKAARSGWNYH